ncbi:MAG: trypsin-like peptidase domain-containing protein [Gemmatimonadaceae bacterium]|nr:trypsin-like peptidase domain-containing protein [Gemmatimonadaceae bacterium]
MKAVLASIALALGLACEGAASAGEQRPPAAAADTAQRLAQAAQISAQRRTAITEAVTRIAPAVVTVQTETVERVPVDVFESFFGGRSGQQTQSGIGSGFIIRPNGVIVTNEHVVGGATRISVMLRDGTTYPAKVLGRDEANDLAVLKVEASNLPIATLGNSDQLLIGEWAIAIGNPFGFVLGNTEPSVTTGVVSATGRNLLGRSEGNGVYLGMIQTDASINPGNSGGPLVNATGEVIGVNSSIYTPSGGSIGLGFAIPINRARRVVDDLLDHGKVRRPWIGEKLLTPDGSNPRDVVAAGVVIRSVVPGSPAAKADLRPGDEIVAVRGKTLRNVFDWEAARLDMRVGESVTLTVRRGERERAVTVVVADLPEVSAPRVTVMREIELTTLTPQIRAERGYRSQQGAVVVGVSDRVRDEIGIQTGDLIVQINRSAIQAASDVSRALESYGGRGIIRMVFERQGYLYTRDFEIR